MAKTNLHANTSHKTWTVYSKYLYLLPAALVVLSVIGYPLARAVAVSFFEFNPLKDSIGFAGFANYAKVLKDPVFHRAVGNSLIWTFGCVALQTVFGMFGAVLLNQQFKGRGIVRGLTLIPWATPSVLAAMMWMWILDGNYGVLNDVLMKIGLILQPIPWISQTGTAMLSIMLIDVWQGIPFFAVMMLAAMQTIPGDLVEAAKLDGASPWKTFWLVKFPIIFPTLLITIVLRLVWTASYMDLMLVITQGGPAYSTLTIPLSSYFRAYSELKFGEAMAMAVVQAAALFGVVLLYLRILARQGVLGNEKP